MGTNNVGLRIKSARENAGLTQTELGDKVGYSASQIGRLEMGKRRTSIDKLREISAACGVTVEYLLGRSLQDAKGVTVEEAQEQILANKDISPGLVELAEAGNMTEIFDIRDYEWRALLSLAESWPDAHLVPKDGWITILFTLRTARHADGTVTGS